MRRLAKDPADRFPDAESLELALASVLARPKWDKYRGQSLVARAGEVSVEEPVRGCLPNADRPRSGRSSQKNIRHPHPQVGVDQDQLAASNQPSVRRQLDGGAAVAVELDHVARLQIGQLGQRQVDPAQLDGQGDRHVERRRRPGRAASRFQVELMVFFSLSQRTIGSRWSSFAERARLRDERAGRPSRRPAEWGFGNACPDRSGRGSGRH